MRIGRGAECSGGKGRCFFGAIRAGSGITYLQWLGWFGYTLLFNILGGLVLVTALRLLRTKELLGEKRRANV